jgi:hydroxymethylpyrimidine/phosphomethylpyrimidine kinase
MSQQKLSTAVLSIAGSDSCGGAGIQADLKTFAAFGVYGSSVITALTAQNTLGVEKISSTGAEMITRQLSCVFEDLPLGAVKTGMLGSAATIGIVSKHLAGRTVRIPLVMDPVMVATSGAVLADAATVEAMRELIGMATLVTPNLGEATALTGIRITGKGDMRSAAHALLETGCRAVLIKGGHLEEPEIRDMLFTSDGERSWTHPLRPGRFHGTGCTLASAVAAGLALGNGIEASVDRAIGFVQQSMRRGGLPVKGSLVLLGHNLPG